MEPPGRKRTAEPAGSAVLGGPKGPAKFDPTVLLTFYLAHVRASIWSQHFQHKQVRTFASLLNTIKASVVGR